MKQLKVLSLLEPWATLVALGVKRIETRAWATSYRGEMFIHSSKAFAGYQRAEAIKEPFRTALRPGGAYAYPELNCGHIIARSEILDCVPITEEFAIALFRDHEDEWRFGDYRPGRYAWLLAEPVRLITSVPIKGRLGIWNWQPEEYPALAV